MSKTLIMKIILTLACIPFIVSCSHLREGLIAYYPLNGNAKDRSGNANHGIEYGDVSYEAGAVRKAVNLDGDGDYIEIPHSTVLSLGTNSFTVACWIRTSSSKEKLSICYKGSKDSTWKQRWLACELVEGKARLGIDDDVIKSQPRHHECNWTYNDGQWHHVAYVRNRRSGNLEIYKDGEIDYVFPDTTESSIMNAESITIGRFLSSGDTRHYEGLIDEFRIYERALDISEIQSLYKKGG